MDAFTVDDLIRCYERGVFPMADAREDDSIFLIDPERRGVLPLEGVHIPRRLARTVRSDLFQVRIDSAFDGVVEACAASRPGRLETWINAPIQQMYGALFARGLAHSVECWREGRMVGGLYGVALGAAFFGESMFSTERDASKVALAHLTARLKFGGYTLLDTQFITDHLQQFGAVEIPRADYRRRLRSALPGLADFYRFSAGATGAEVLQAISQAS
ncbi:leucyl/phenylalanyl-tRNA--protein transferase [Caulobacter henricii]|uniref:Leucyl/phenylalanyl-tRNA--protein transferase n=1 Tax=Caulobacter henricii TaxID=69395 RepID=A0A0P0P0F6_9CAUL|nr:leucyl/phenylalanyl-tRNA--protein transferase [Caulobacter henricii]ALL13509.1 leucyl/phenylalanyl-tRNA--protein transferase [Caulobacter henricii]